MKLANIVVGLAATLLLSTGAFARGGHHGGGRWMQQLNLTTEQQERLKPIFEQKKADRAQFRSQFEAILTPEQRAQLSSDGHHGRGAWKNLNLTDAQRAQMKQLRESNKAQRMAKREQMQQQLAQVLTPEQMQKWQAMKAQHHGQRRHHRDGGAQNGAPQDGGDNR